MNLECVQFYQVIFVQYETAVYGYYSLKVIAVILTHYDLPVYLWKRSFFKIDLTNNYIPLKAPTVAHHCVS